MTCEFQASHEVEGMDEEGVYKYTVFFFFF